MRTLKTIMKKGRRNDQFTRKTASKSGKEREPHKTEKETKQNCKGISTLRWTTWSLKKVEFLQVAQKENVTGLSVNSNRDSAQTFWNGQNWAIRYAIMIIVREAPAVEVYDDA